MTIKDKLKLWLEPNSNEERLKIGAKKYEKTVPIDGSRNNMKEAVEEALDLSVYLAAVSLQLNNKENIMEKRKDKSALKQAVTDACLHYEIRNKNKIFKTDELIYIILNALCFKENRKNEYYVTLDLEYFDKIVDGDIDRIIETTHEVLKKFNDKEKTDV